MAIYTSKHTMIDISVLKISSSPFRVKFLELENKQLQDKTLKLANQIGVLERALRNLQSVCNAEVKRSKWWLFINVIYNCWNALSMFDSVIMYKNVFIISISVIGGKEIISF